MVTDGDDVTQSATPNISDSDTSSAAQDGSASDVAGWAGPKDVGSTNEGRGLTEGGTDTEVNVQGDITKGGMAGDYGDGGTVVGGESNPQIGTVGEGIPPKPEGDYEV